MTTNATTNLLGAAVLSSLLALSFNASAEQPAHPILDTSTGATAYSGYLINAVDATGVQDGQYLAGGAVTTLEAALKQPTPDARVKYFPPKPRTGEAFVSFVTPPSSLYSTAAIPLCVGTAGKEGGVLWTGKILTNGQVVADSALPPADKATGNPCKVFLGMAQSELQGAALAATNYPPAK